MKLTELVFGDVKFNNAEYYYDAWVQRDTDGSWSAEVLNVERYTKTATVQLDVWTAELDEAIQADAIQNAQKNWEEGE